jgi:hypothetical protein
VDVLTCKQVDLNHDGWLDIVYYYDDRGVQTMLEEFDPDFVVGSDRTVTTRRASRGAGHEPCL